MRETFGFGRALKHLEGGYRVAREGWNGHGMFAYLVPANSYPVQTGAAKAHFGEGSMVPYRAYFALKTAQDDVATWTPSNSDILAKDWFCLEADGVALVSTAHPVAFHEYERVVAQKDGAYHERNQLVAALSKLFPASLERHPEDDKDWEDDWRWIVFIDLPTGQATWHIHDSELRLFDHLERGAGRTWDGHSTEAKYDRLARIVPGMTTLHVEAEDPNNAKPPPGFHRYRSHKVVEAAEIWGYGTDNVGLFVTMKGVKEKFRPPEDIFARGWPHSGDLLVRYNAGTPKEYLSWSPRDVFLDGYTRISED